MALFPGRLYLPELLIALAIGMARGNRFQEAFVMNCDHTFADGITYDLTPLTRYLRVF